MKPEHQVIEYQVGETVNLGGVQFRVKADGVEGCRKCSLSTLIYNNPHCRFCGEVLCEERKRPESKNGVRFVEIK